MAFLPENYEAPSKASNYLKFKEWETTFRILSDAITWWEYRDNKQPLRSKDDPDMEWAKFFRAFIVWDYKEEKLKVCEITQPSIQKAIMAYYAHKSYGDPKWYDLTITRTGKDMDTRYAIIALPPVPTDVKIMDIYINAKPDLEKLYEWGHPIE